MRPSPEGGGPLRRFDLTERLTHWATAALFGILMLTALPLYIGSLAAVVGRRHLLAEIHVWTGVALPVPLVLALIGPWGAQLRTDLRRANRWVPQEVRWLRSLGRQGHPALGKFNPGQKLNAVFTGGSMVVMLGTGSIMHWFGPFPDSWRTGATFVHDVLATAVFVVVVGHVSFALTHPAALRSMISGRIARSWAEREAPGWLEESEAQGRVSTPRGSLAGSQSSRLTAQRKAKRSVIPPT
jgi:formate dehydrogenase subunit gamma